jgi:hypothetical protein
MKQKSCIINIQIWLYVHLIIILIVQISLMNISIIFSYVCLLLFIISRFRSFLRMIIENIRFQVYNQEERYSYGIDLFKKEITTILVYISFAFLYNWFGSVNIA